MGQLVSGQGGKRSRGGLDISNPVGSPPANIGFEDSANYLPRLKIDLEDGDFDLTRWEPQQLITTYIPKVVHQNETPRKQAKISLPSRVLKKPQTTANSGSIKATKETDEEEFGLSSDERIILKDEGDFTQSPIGLIDSRDDEKDDGLGSLAQNLTWSRTQHDRKALMKEVHHLLHSASLDDISQIASYLKTHEGSIILDCKHHLNTINLC